MFTVSAIVNLPFKPYILPSNVEIPITLSLFNVSESIIEPLKLSPFILRVPSTLSSVTLSLLESPKSISQLVEDLLINPHLFHSELRYISPIYDEDIPA